MDEDNKPKLTDEQARYLLSMFPDEVYQEKTKMRWVKAGCVAMERSCSGCDHHRIRLNLCVACGEDNNMVYFSSKSIKPVKANEVKMMTMSEALTLAEITAKKLSIDEKECVDFRKQLFIKAWDEAGLIVGESKYAKMVDAAKHYLARIGNSASQVGVDFSKLIIDADEELRNKK